MIKAPLATTATLIARHGLSVVSYSIDAALASSEVMALGLYFSTNALTSAANPVGNIVFPDQ